MTALPLSAGRGSGSHGVDACCAAASGAAPSAAASTAAGIHLCIRASERLQHRLGAGDIELARLLDMQCLDDAVVDQHRVALGADPHPFLDAVELEPHRAGEVAAAVAEHHDL